MTLPINTVSKLYYFDCRIKSFYEQNGYNSIPFDNRKVYDMIESSRKELSELFIKIWGLSMGYHLLDKFYSYNGNILDFYTNLDQTNMDSFSNKDW